ncbi:dihydrofolate reductase family protein [Microtetraspora malaysiensis]|uniref:dihydrofolate reductase family protein n=1 Tax=Microtetraspora malaysiensis TaxID=161358 RepID=UPI003D8BB06D
MATVIANMSMSLDGFVAHPSSGADRLFGWYFNGDVAVPTAVPEYTFQMSEASAALLRDATTKVGALVSGRRTFDDAKGWGGKHPMGAPVFVVTHAVPDGWPQDDTSIIFVTDGVESAVEKATAVAGEKIVAVASADITQQCLNAGLLDEVHVDLVPVFLGAGIRFFDNLDGVIELEDPVTVEGRGVTHLRYRLKSR